MLGCWAGLVASLGMRGKPEENKVANYHSNLGSGSEWTGQSHIRYPKQEVDITTATEKPRRNTMPLTLFDVLDYLHATKDDENLGPKAAASSFDFEPNARSFDSDRALSHRYHIQSRRNHGLTYFRYPTTNDDEYGIGSVKKSQGNSFRCKFQ